MTRAGSRFRRAEPRRRARAVALALLAELPRVNCRTIAEHAGDSSPDGMQHLLARAKWDADGVRDDVRGYVLEHLGDPGLLQPASGHAWHLGDGRGAPLDDRGELPGGKGPDRPVAQPRLQPAAAYCREGRLPARLEGGDDHEGDNNHGEL